MSTLPRLFHPLRFLGAISIAGLFTLASCQKDLPSRNEIAQLKTQYPVAIYKGKGKAPDVQILKSRPSHWVSFDEVSKQAMGAIVVSEDWAFFQHDGYDMNQIKLAIETDLKKGRFLRGASTITQQVVKNVYLTRAKTVTRKLSEVMLAIQMDDVLSKKRILEIYLNIAEWGEGIYGLGKAAQFYFGKPASSLSAREGAFLAMLLPSPIRYGSSFKQKQLTPYAKKTISSILHKMVQAHYLSEGERDQALGEKLSFESVD